MEKFPKVGVGVFVIKDGKILMQKRKNAHGDGCWSLPGGHLEFNEKIEECAAREVMEETGIEIENIKFGPYTNDVFKKEEKHYITIFAISNYKAGNPTIMEPNKSDGLNWFSLDNLPSPLFLPLENLLKTGFNPIKS